MFLAYITNNKHDLIIQVKKKEYNQLTLHDLKKAIFYIIP
jgi:hypothetical protein